LSINVFTTHALYRTSSVTPLLSIAVTFAFTDLIAHPGTVNVIIATCARADSTTPLFGEDRAGMYDSAAVVAPMQAYVVESEKY
jgi:hypothetical protein